VSLECRTEFRTPGRKFGFEFKYADAPIVTRSLSVAQHDLGLERVFVVNPGKDTYPLNDWAEALAIGAVQTRLAKLRRRRGNRTIVPSGGLKGTR
jgi:hypothetical protein